MRRGVGREGVIGCRDVFSRAPEGRIVWLGFDLCNAASIAMGSGRLDGARELAAYPGRSNLQWVIDLAVLLAERRCDARTSELGKALLASAVICHSGHRDLLS